MPASSSRRSGDISEFFAGLSRKRSAYVVLPCNLLESDGVDVLVEDERDGNDEVEDVETLRTKTVRENLDSVHDDEGCECKTREDGEPASQN